jgi:hypothetical protein
VEIQETVVTQQAQPLALVALVQQTPTLDQALLGVVVVAAGVLGLAQLRALVAPVVVEQVEPTRLLVLLVQRIPAVAVVVLVKVLPAVTAVPGLWLFVLLAP